MGVESFQLELKPKVNFDSAVETVGSIPSCSRLESSSNSAEYFQYASDCGQGIVELMVSRFTDLNVVISIRFALCQSESVDKYFINLVRSIQKQTASDLAIPDSNQDASSDIDDDIILSNISQHRKTWVETFGSKTGVFTCEEAIIKGADGFFQ